MFNNHPLREAMITAVTKPAVAEKKGGSPIFDSANDGEMAMSGAASYAAADMRLKAAAVVQQWAETTADDMGGGETLSDRLIAMVVGVVDADKDGEISDVEQEVCDMLLNEIYDYLETKGVSESDCDALLNDGDAEAGERVHDLIVAALPDGDEAAAAEMDAFAFDKESDSAVFDAAVLDAVYKKKVVIRAGHKVRINKRVSGHVRLSAKQKISIRKMLRKSHSATATMHRMKSTRIRRQAGL
jgi:hypothetical protein